MSMTLGEIRDLERVEIENRREKERNELKNELESVLNNDSVNVLSLKDDGEYGYKVDVSFTLDGYEQTDDFYWRESESRDAFIDKIKSRIEYIKQLRKEYPEYCKQNDFIQSNSRFYKEINLTHMGYNRTFSLNLKLADYLKLPNTTDTGFGGGDYEIKRTPKRVEEYNKNIDIAIDTLLDCISELKQRKYKF